MKRKLAFAGALILAALSGVRAEPNGRVWILGGLEDKNADSIYLGYGTPESDDSVVSFTCAPESGVMKIWISETSDKAKAGEKATALLAVGATKAKAAGKLMPNEEAGVPSFEGRLPAKDPIFTAMATGETLDLSVGSAKHSTPLAGDSDKFRKFAAACAKR